MQFPCNQQFISHLGVLGAFYVQVKVFSIPLTKITRNCCNTVSLSHNHLLTVPLSWEFILYAAIHTGYPWGPGVLGLPVLLAHHDHPNKTKFIRLVVHQKKNYAMTLLPIWGGWMMRYQKTLWITADIFLRGGWRGIFQNSVSNTAIRILTWPRLFKGWITLSSG